MVFLESMFEEFCNHLDGKLKWSARELTAKQWTKTIFDFFDQLNTKESVPFVVTKDFMRIDYVWRYDSSKYSTSDIELALEHENAMEKIDSLLEKEIQHLIDIKARSKVGIFYIPQGDEKEFIQKIKERIKRQTMRSNYEKYLIILGYATTYHKQRAILFKGFLFDQDGELKEQKEKIVLQAQ